MEVRNGWMVSLTERAVTALQVLWVQSMLEWVEVRTFELP